MQIVVLLEEPSAEEALRHLLPQIINGRARFKSINMRNKSRLLQELPSRLSGYTKRIQAGEDLRIVVLVDRDDDDCPPSQVRRRMVYFMLLTALQ